MDGTCSCRVTGFVFSEDKILLFPQSSKFLVFQCAGSPGQAELKGSRSESPQLTGWPDVMAPLPALSWLESPLTTH